MKELLAHLREHGYKTFIVSGGGIEFMCAPGRRPSGIPPEQVVGSSIKTSYAVREDGTPVLERLAELNFIDDKAGKPWASTSTSAGGRLMAFGNSDGDFQMLEWTTAAATAPAWHAGAPHRQCSREWAYDRESHIGRLDRA